MPCQLTSSRVSSASSTASDSSNRGLVWSNGTPIRSVSVANAPLPTPSISRPSQSACAWTTSPANTRMSRSGSWQIEVRIRTRSVCAAIFTASCSGEGTSSRFCRWCSGTATPS